MESSGFQTELTLGQSRLNWIRAALIIERGGGYLFSLKAGWNEDYLFTVLGHLTI
jgi:hypothetical protein